MSTVNSTLNSTSLYTQANSQAPNMQKVHHHHHHENQSQDSNSIEAGKQDSQLLGSKFTNGASSILNNLVSDGTLTQDQENAVQGAFQAAKQANSSSSAGTYSNNGSRGTNPISGLVANGTISQSQADSIQNAFKAAHHNHHHVEQTQDSAQAAVSSTNDVTQSLVQALENQDQLLGSSSNDPEEDLMQSLENSNQFI